MLGINWTLHAACWPQSSDKVERINRTIKNSLGKLAVYLLKKTGYSLYEILYHRPPPTLWGLPGTPCELGETELCQQLQAVGNVAEKVSEWVNERCPISLFSPVHPFSPGGKDPKLILTTPTAMKVKGVPAASDTWEAKTDLHNPCKMTLRRTETTSPTPITPRKLTGL
ncbi:hypothetical protein AAY473_040075 [Plecturocebus cupreus]